jgi:dihydroflavonol-4-reductase
VNDTGPTLVTGATGFVGSAVARALLAKGHTLRLLVRPGGNRANIAGLPAELAEGDLKDPASLQRAAAGCRYVVHVAADYRLWVPDPDAMNRANVEGTRALLLAAQAAGAERIVYCSSVAALGLIGDGTPADETTPNQLDKVIGTYKRSKYLAEQAVLALVRDHRVPAVIVNPTAPVGPRDIKPTPTGKMIADAAAGRMPAYVDTGLNVAHVDDVAAGHVLALERGQVGEVYILGGEDLSMAALLALVAELSGRPAPKIRLPHAALYPVALACEALARFGVEPIVTRDVLAMARKKMFFSSAKARAALGYTARPAREAVADAIAWFRAEGRVPQ